MSEKEGRRRAEDAEERKKAADAQRAQRNEV
jgi:hypothetical protein